MSSSKYKQIMRETSIKIEENEPERYKRYKTICDRYIGNKVKLNIYGNCIMCGRGFATRQPHQKYCCENCGNKHRKRKHNAQRRKKGFYLLIDNIFPDDIDIDYHHIHPHLSFVMPLPRKNHQEGNGNLKLHIDIANKWVNFYFGLDVVEFLY